MCLVWNLVINELMLKAVFQYQSKPYWNILNYNLDRSKIISLPAALPKQTLCKGQLEKMSGSELIRTTPAMLAYCWSRSAYFRLQKRQVSVSQLQNNKNDNIILLLPFQPALGWHLQVITLYCCTGCEILYESFWEVGGKCNTELESFCLAIQLPFGLVHRKN